MTKSRQVPTLILASVLALALARPALAETDPEAAAMAEALTLAAQQNWDAAAADARRAGPLGTALIEWQRLRSGDGAFPEYAAFAGRHPDWPGLSYLRLKGESTIPQAAPPDSVIAYFSTEPPQTAAGSLALQTALKTVGKSREAEAEAKRAWLALSFDQDAQDTEIKAFGPSIHGLNAKRLDTLLWKGRTTEAARMLPLVAAGEAALGRARIGLQTGANGVDGLVAAVPASLQDDPGLLHDRFAWRMDHDNQDGAEELLLQASASARTLGEPLAWAGDRARLARKEMVSGDPRKAYRIAAEDHLSAGGAFADLEFLAGYIALEKLHDPKTALRHFRALGGAVKTPISLSRASYWEGRAQDALGDVKAARAAYAEGAKYQTAFYGLLSAEKLGEALDPALLSQARYPDWRRARFLSSQVLQAGLLLEKAGDRRTAKRFFLQVAEGLSGTELGQLSDLALAIGEPHVAVLVAKKAADKGIVLPRAYYPLTGLARQRLAVPTDLALAIARRESEFDVSVVSPAGALGLMQVMPATAQKMSGVVGVAYDRARLTTDGDYNVQLGSAYLAQLTSQFGPALTLVASGYNAGPHRASAWIDQLGDPRTPGVDAVNWIESVPFTETRDYIMRVAESYEIYRSKLAGHPLKIRLTDELKGR